MKKELLFGLIGFTILAIILVGAWKITSSQSILGVSNIDTLGVENGNLLITTSVGNEKDNLIVDLSQSSLNSKLVGDGWSVDKGVRISLDLIDSKEVYTLVNNGGDSNTFYSLKEVDMGNRPGSFDVSENQYRDWCRQGVNGNVARPSTLFATGYKTSLFDIPNVKCFYTEPIATRGQIDGSGRFEYHIEVDANGQKDYISQNHQVASINNGKIIVSFEGGITAPQFIVSVPYDVIFVNGKFNYLIQQNTGFTGQNNVQSKFTTCVNQQASGSTYDKYRACLSVYNSQLSSATESRNSQFGAGVVKYLNFDTLNTNTGVLRATVEPTTYPILKLFVDGSFIGLERLSGVPEITQCVTDISGFGGEQFKKKLGVKNTGNENGYFLFESSCTNPKIEIFGTSGNVGSGETRISDVVVTGTSDKEGVTESAKCTITISDKVSQKTDSCTFDVKLEFSNLICEPNKNFCSDDATKVLKCGTNGRISTELKTCSSDEVCSLVGTSFDCIKKSEVGNNNEQIDSSNDKKEEGKISCDFGESYREEGSKLLGIFPGKSAGCYTSGWVYFSITILVVLILMVLFIGYRKLT